MASDLKTSNPIKIMGIVIILMLVAVICIQLFVKQKVQLSDGTTGKAGVFGNIEPDYEMPAPAAMEPTV